MSYQNMPSKLSILIEFEKTSNSPGLFVLPNRFGIPKLFPNLMPNLIPNNYFNFKVTHMRYNAYAL